jgi:hypothetical protein
MKNVSFVEGYSDNFGDVTVKTVSVQSVDGKVDFIIKPGEHAAVYGSLGLPKEIRRLTSLFIKKYEVSTLVNQVHRPVEVRMMYSLGFRMPERKPDSKKHYPLADTLDRLKKRTSILMALEGEVPYDCY